MNKIMKKPSTALFPIPTVLVSSQLEGHNPNIITIAWTGVLNSEPPMVYISVNPQRHSHKMIKESGEFVINIPSVSQVKIVDYCGVVSGRNTNKFLDTNLTPIPASYVKAPLISECPVNIECKVKEVMFLGSHDVFISEILAIHFNEDVLDSKQHPDLSKIQSYAYCLGEYWSVNDKIGSYGYSNKQK
jgi:flavin reductase (DIM6/NTAB) family NADH-FMN oxidoreductase RutF